MFYCRLSLLLVCLVLVLIRLVCIWVCIRMGEILRIYIEFTSGIRMPIYVVVLGELIRRLGNLYGIKENIIIFQGMVNG